MKKIFFLICAVFVSCFAATLEVNEINGSYHTHSKNYGKAKYFRFENDMANYMIYYQWVNPSPKRAGYVQIGMPQPVYWQGFVNRGFTSLSVNGISCAALEPKSFTTYNENGRAGLRVKYNFDGVLMNLDFYMTADSQLLFMEWSVDEENEEPITSIKLNITTYPSYSMPNGGKSSPEYGRKIWTPVREIGQMASNKPGWNKLNKEDTQLVMYDEKFDYPKTEKAQGPCYMAIDWTNITSGRVWFGNIYCNNFEFVLNPTGKIWRFGLWETKKKQSNKEFFDYKAANEQYFILK